MSGPDVVTLTFILAGFGLIAILVPAIIMQRRANAKSGGATSTRPPNLKQLEAMPPDARLEAMRKSIRQAAWWLVALGVLSIVANPLLAGPWGGILILIGAMSFFFHSDYAMFIVYTGAMVYAALTNLIAGQIGWIVFGLIQLYWAYSNYKQFRLFQSAAKAVKESAAITAEGDQPVNAPPPVWDQPDEEDSRAARYFPWLALGLSGSGFLLFLIMFIGYVAGSIMGVIRNMPPWYSFIMEMSLLVSIFGVPFGLSALLSGYSRKAASVAAMCIGGLAIAVNIWFIILAMTNSGG